MATLAWKQEGTAFRKVTPDGEMELRIGAMVAIMPVNESDDFFERCDMMTSAIFLWTLCGIVRGVEQGRHLIRQYVTPEEAAWFLGVFRLTLENEADIRQLIDEGMLIDLAAFLTDHKPDIRSEDKDK